MRVWCTGCRPARPGLVEQVVEGPVVEAGAGRVVAVGDVDDLVDPGPQRRGQAERARLARGDQHAAGQGEVVDRPARRADRHHLGVCRRVQVAGDPVDALGHHLVATDDERRERAAAGRDVVDGDVHDAAQARLGDGGGGHRVTVAPVDGQSFGRRSAGRGDGCGPDHDVAVVEDDRLTGGDPANRPAQLDLHRPRRRPRTRRRRGRPRRAPGPGRGTPPDASARVRSTAAGSRSVASTSRSSAEPTVTVLVTGETSRT